MNQTDTTSGDVTSGDRTDGDGAAGERLRRYLWAVLAAAISLPIALAAARGIRRSYLPIGDNALIEIRGRDVLTGHHPWLGTWSSASLSTGVDVNHPGPLLFDVVAVPVKLFGGGPGIAIAIASLHIAVVWAIAWSANRLGGPTVAAVTMLGTAGLVWSLGSEMLYDPWQPNVLILPFLLVLVLVWGVIAGRHLMLPWAVVVASFCVQTHLSYVFVAPAMVVLAACFVIGRAWQHREEMELRRGLASVWIAIGAGLLAWSQPIIEQLVHGRDGNLWRLATADQSGEGTRTGLALGVRLVAAVVALPPWWGRSGFVDTIPITQWTGEGASRQMIVPGLVGAGVAAVALAVLAALIVLVWQRARSLGDHVTAGAAVVVATALAVATVSVIITPIDRLGLSPHKVRWLWPISVFVTVTLAVALVGEARARLDRRRPAAGESGQPAGTVDRVSSAVAAGVVAIAALATIPYHAQDAGPVAFRHEMDAVRSIVDQLDPLEGRGVVLVDAGGLRFAEPFTAPVKAGLQRRGIPFVVDDEGLARQMGERRRFDGHADVRVFLREGDAAFEVPDGVELVALVEGGDHGGAPIALFVEPLHAGAPASDGPGTEAP